MTVDLNKALYEFTQGRLVVIPTETVYGLAGDATNDLAVAQIFATKGRPSFNPLIIHVSSIDQAKELAVFTPLAEKLAQFWPGPLTLVLKKQPHAPISPLASAGLDSVAIRIPRHPLTLELIRQFGKPIAAPSANRSNHLSPTSPENVRQSLGDKTPYILEAGSCHVGLESTIIDAQTNQAILLRPGGLSLEDIQEQVGEILKPSNHAVTAPGMLKKHYAPQAFLRLNDTQTRTGEVLLGFGPMASTKNLSPKGCVIEAAANLFKLLHELDNLNPSTIVVAPIPEDGLGLAINDRLKRAASL